MSNATEPTDAVIIERAFSMALEASETVVLQANRVQRDEPEDAKFIFRAWADWQFLLIALWRLRRTATIATRVASVGSDVQKAIDQFDSLLPQLRVMRNVIEHIDNYVVESSQRHHKAVDRKGLQVGSWDDTTFTWHIDGEQTLDLKVALPAAQDLFTAVKSAKDAFPKALRSRA